MRGKPLFQTPSESPPGITPVCAGKTRRTWARSDAGGDHPRVCGENGERRPNSREEWGSPPRVRGKHDPHVGHFLGHRITPACAGKTGTHHRGGAGTWDHPRVCGENLMIQITSGRIAGSPPRVRGKRNYGELIDGELGITPACAGKTHPAWRHRRRPWDHPRVCGENSSSPNHRLKLSGSPPRVRGKRSHLNPYRRESGITPACAGKTTRRCSCSCRCWDHPRVCGENIFVIVGAAVALGSPPRVRGKRLIGSRAGALWRITPACAGKTRSRTRTT